MRTYPGIRGFVTGAPPNIREALLRIDTQLHEQSAAIQKLGDNKQPTVQNIEIVGGQAPDNTVIIDLDLAADNNTYHFSAFPKKGLWRLDSYIMVYYKSLRSVTFSATLDYMDSSGTSRSLSLGATSFSTVPNRVLSKSDTIEFDGITEPTVTTTVSISAGPTSDVTYIMRIALTQLTGF